MCCRLRCSFCCCYITGTIIFIAFFFFLILFAAIFGPSSVKFHVIDTALTQFNLTSNNTLYYNFKLNITVRNPNKDVIVYYRRITAIAWYKDREFAWVTLPPFDQGHKNTTLLQIAFEGHQVIDLKPRHVAEYDQETKAGIYNNVAVDLNVRIRTKYGRLKSSRYNPPVVQCKSMRVPLIGSNGKWVAPFNDTKCRTGYFFQDRDAENAAS